MLVSLTGELVLLSMAVLVPLACTEHLPSFEWKSAALAPPPPRPPDPAPQKQIHTSVRNTTSPNPRVFRPQQIFVALPRREQEAITIDAPPENGIEGSIGAPTVRFAFPTRVVVDPPPLPPPVKANETAASNPIRVSQGVQMAKLIRQVKPEYPPLAKAARISGVVHLIGVIGKDGTIQNLQLISGHALLARAAIEAVRQWVYRPTLLSGQAVEVIAPIDVNFTLTQ